MPPEMEKKYLIKNQEAFSLILGSTPRPLEKIDDYVVKSFNSKARSYRYFDTFSGQLAEKGLLAYIGPGPLETEGASVSYRARETDFVFTIKLTTFRGPGDRDEYQHRPIPSEGTDFYALRPEEFHSWEPMKKIREIIGEDHVLQEVVRLEILTNRFELYKDDNRKVEVAVDEVKGEVLWGVRNQFWELEVEVAEKGTLEDMNKISDYFTQSYGENLVLSSLPKWIKMLRLMRGEEILPDEG